jgi:hypothetical protein
MTKPMQATSTVGQEIDVLVAEHVMGHGIVRQKKGGVKERTSPNQMRPLRAYSRDMNAAWEVAQKMHVTLIPIEDHSWFAFVGKNEGWTSPAELMQHMADNSFGKGGAAVQESAPLAICLAALTAIQKRMASRGKKPKRKAEVGSVEATIMGVDDSALPN